ncbi:MAG: hypothetical protein JO308_08740 [Verrucomicrobia bacterium]|nr:hypothetical protein [Verrucomicrobiota bacterium]
MSFAFVHRCFYGSESDSVYAYALSGIFNCECTGDRVAESPISPATSASRGDGVKFSESLMAREFPTTL